MLNDLNKTQITNLAKLLTYLFLEKSLPLSVLKVRKYLLVFPVFALSVIYLRYNFLKRIYSFKTAKNHKETF